MKPSPLEITATSIGPPTVSISSVTLRLNDVKLTSRSEEHTSELQSQSNLVCRLLLEKKKKPNFSSSTDQPRRARPAGPAPRARPRNPKSTKHTYRPRHIVTEAHHLGSSLSTRLDA